MGKAIEHRVLTFVLLAAVICVIGGMHWYREVNLEKQVDYAIENEYSTYLNGEAVENDAIDLDYMVKSSGYNVTVDNIAKSILITKRRDVYREHDTSIMPIYHILWH